MMSCDITKIKPFDYITLNQNTGFHTIMLPFYWSFTGMPLFLNKSVNLPLKSSDVSKGKSHQSEKQEDLHHGSGADLTCGRHLYLTACRSSTNPGVLCRDVSCVLPLPCHSFILGVTWKNERLDDVLSMINRFKRWFGVTSNQSHCIWIVNWRVTVFIRSDFCVCVCVCNSSCFHD